MCVANPYSAMLLYVFSFFITVVHSQFSCFYCLFIVLLHDCHRIDLKIYAKGSKF